MARKPTQPPFADVEVPQNLPGEPTEHTQILTKLAQSERAILVMAEAIKTQLRVEHAFTISPEMMAQISSQIAAEIVKIQGEATTEKQANTTPTNALLKEVQAMGDAFKKVFNRTMEQAIADGRVALNAQVGEVRTELRKSTTAAEAVHGRIGTTAASMEAALDHFDYCNPAVSVSAERRLKVVTRHAGLIQSAATVAGVAFVEMLLHVMGMR